MKTSEIKLFQILFLLASVWNLIGAYFGYFNTAITFQAFFGRSLDDPLIHAIYQGAWGTTLIYLFGYLIVAKDPIKNTGIVIVGGIGKIGFAITLLKLNLMGMAAPIVYIVIVGDTIFFGLFLYYFYRIVKTNNRLI